MICTVLVLIALSLFCCLRVSLSIWIDQKTLITLVFYFWKILSYMFCLFVSAPWVAYPSPQYNFCESSATELSSIVRHDIFCCISYLYSTSSPSFFFFYYRLTESAQRFSSFREEYNVTRPGTTDYHYIQIGNQRMIWGYLDFCLFHYQ